MKPEIKEEFRVIIESLNDFMNKINKEGTFTCDFYYGREEPDFMRLQEVDDEDNEVESFDVSASKGWHGNFI